MEILWFVTSGDNNDQEKRFTEMKMLSDLKKTISGLQRRMLTIRKRNVFGMDYRSLTRSFGNAIVLFQL